MSKYAETGVDVKKKGIEVFQEIINSIFPEAFCVVTPDPGMPGYGIVTHADSAGSKPIQAYLNWRETGDLSWFEGLAQDVLAMNLNDVSCVGAEPINFVDYIALNPLKIPKKELLKILSEGFRKSLERLENLGLRVYFSGGETADLPDQLRTFDISGVVNGRVDLAEVITGASIEPGDIIIGLRSGGKTKYEDRENSGIMCNGLTLARHCLLRREYQDRYPEIMAPEGKSYYGRFRVDDYIDELGMTIGEALTSPMRFFAPIVKKILEECSEMVSGMVHNMGGGLTKGLRIGYNVKFVKDKLFEPDPIFHLIQRESGESWKDMFMGYNMGVGFEVIARPEAEDEIISICENFGLEAKRIGRCERSSGKNVVVIKSRWGTFVYE
ncbi:phosphoribosylformylglycinamidine cyclo-ligase [Candidatus Bathyarchaeota archaeon]|nr:MAG: phosphoribosylformylglycinamidine cyclo-ligase [Candidatus Bathyarchaeota archaeon]